VLSVPQDELLMLSTPTSPPVTGERQPAILVLLLRNEILVVALTFVIPKNDAWNEKLTILVHHEQATHQ
jgi:hypothetical protein